MNANIMNTQIFYIMKYHLNGHQRSQKVTFMFISTLTYVLMDNFLSLFQIRSIPISCSHLCHNILGNLFLSMYTFSCHLFDGLTLYPFLSFSYSLSIPLSLSLTPSLYLSLFLSLSLYTFISFSLFLSHSFSLFLSLFLSLHLSLSLYLFLYLFSPLLRINGRFSPCFSRYLSSIVYIENYVFRNSLFDINSLIKQIKKNIIQ